MKRLLNAAAALLCVFGLPLAHAQLTTITASSISMGGTAIAAGTVTFTPVSSSGIPIAFAQGGGGLNSPTAFSCTITAGAIDSGCQIPDAALTTPANILYSVQITNTGTQKTFTLQQVSGITGSTWPLDHYGPPAQTSNIQPVQSAYGTAAPPSSCISPSFYTRNYSGGQLYTCVNGTFVLVTSGSGGSVTYGTTADTAAEGNDGRFAANASAAAAAQTTADAALPRSGGTMTGSLVLNADPSASLQAATKSYVDSHSFAVNPVSGATAEYRFLSSESGTSATDYVGSNSCVFGATTQAPTRTAYGLSFTWASKQYCDTGIAIGSAVTVSAVVQAPITYANGFALSYSAYFGSSDGNAGLLQATASGNNLGYPIGRGFNFAGTSSSNGFSVVTWVRNSTGDKVYLNGIPVATNVTATGSIAAGTGTLWLGTIGASCDTGRCAFDGAMLWADVYPSALSDGQVAQLAAFERSSVVTGKGFVPTIPLPTTSAVVHCDGDSITFGQGAVSFCAYLTLNQTSTIDNTGYPGWTMKNMFTGEDRILGAYPPNAASASLIIFGGTNDSTSTPAQTAGYLSAYIRKASAAGWKVFVVTMLDRGTALASYKNGYNALIRANWKAWGAAGIIDMAAIPALGADNAAVGAAFQSDHIHPVTSYQQGAMATAASEALNYYYGSSESSPNIYTSTSQTLTAADGNVVWTPTGAATGTLPECLGITGAGFRITNGSATNAITISAAGSETITGSATIAANASATFRVMLTGPTTGGCYWVRQ